MKIDEQGTDTENSSSWRASELDKGLQCMRALGYARLGACTREQEPLPVVTPTWSWALIGGLALDDTLSFYERARMTGARPVGSILRDLYQERMRETTKTFSEKGTIVSQSEDDNPEYLLRYGSHLIGLYEEHSLGWQPIGVQLETSRDLCTLDEAGHEIKVTLHGHIDYLRETETNKIIGDWKFTKKSPGQMPARTYSRGWAYDWMLVGASGPEDKPHGMVELTYLRKGLKTPKIESDTHFVTAGEHKQVERTLLTIASMYRAKYFPMTAPDSWICDPKWCGFHSICRGSPTGPALIPGER